MKIIIYIVGLLKTDKEIIQKISSLNKNNEKKIKIVSYEYFQEEIKEINGNNETYTI